MMKVHQNLTTAERREVLRDISHQRLSQNWQGRLGPICGQRPEPRSIAGRKYHRAHVGYSSGDGVLDKGWDALNKLRKQISLERIIRNHHPCGWPIANRDLTSLRTREWVAPDPSTQPPV